MSLALLIASLKTATDFGPQSKPMWLSAIPVSTVAVPTAAFSANWSPVTKSTGKWIWTLFALAFSKILLTIFDPSSSNNDFPI